MIDPQRVDEWLSTIRGDDLPNWAYVASIGFVGGIAIATLVIQSVHLLQRPNGLYGQLLGSLIPVALAVVLLTLGVRMHRLRSPDVVVRIGVWCFVGSLALLGVGVVSIAYQRTLGVVMGDVLYVLTSHATVGAILGALIGSYDGRRHARRRALRAEHERVQQLSNRLTILNRVFRHDIRNAINVIMGHAKYIREGRSDVVRSTEQIEAKAHELLAMSDSARRLEPLLEREGVASAVVDVAPILREAAATLDADVETDVPDTAAVRCSPLIEEVIEELLANAVEHNDSAVPQVSITVRTDGGADRIAGDAGTTTIRIADDGPGIPDAELEVLERGHETDLRHTSGLGLWFVHWVVDASNGRVRFEPNEPCGSVVELSLPASGSSDPVLSTTDGRPSTGRVSAVRPADRDGRRSP